MRCPECDRLWKLYAYTTRQQIEVINAHLDAKQKASVRQKRLLAAALQGAAEWREIAKAAVVEHETAHLNEAKN